MRLVLADNDPDALDLLELDLRLEGHEIVALAADGEQAVAACDRARPDVLVVDFRMPPGVDGLEVARRVLAAGTAGRVVVHSNHLDPGVVARAEALGARWLRKGDLRAVRAALSGPHGPDPAGG